MKVAEQILSPSNNESSNKIGNQGTLGNFNGLKGSLSQFKKPFQSNFPSQSENQATVRVSVSANSLKVVDNETNENYLGHYKEELAQERQKNFMLNEKINELQEFNDRFNPTRILDLEQEITRIIQENDEFRKCLEGASDLQTNFQKANHENSILKNQNKLLHNEINLLNQRLNDLEEYEANCIQLAKDSQILLNQNERLSKDYQMVSSDYETLKGKLEEILKINSCLSNQLEIVSKAKKSLESRLSLYSGQISNLEQRADHVSFVEKENLELKTKMRAFEQELNFLETLAAKHDEIDSELTKSKALIKEYKEGLQEADFQIENLNRVLSENLGWKEKFFDVEKKLNLVLDSSNEVSKLRTAFSVSDKANNQLLNENAILVNNQEALRFKLESKDKEIERLLQTCSQNDRAINDLVKENEEYARLLKVAEKSLEEVNSLAKQKEKANINLSLQNSQIIAEKKHLQEEIKTLESKNQESQSSIHNLKERIHEITKEMEKMKGSSNEILKERDYLKSKFNGIEERLTKISALEFELEKTKSKLNVSETLRNAAQANVQEMQDKLKAIKNETNLYDKLQVLLQKNQQLGDILAEQNLLAERLQKELDDSKSANSKLVSAKSQSEQELKKIKEDLSFWQEKYMKGSKVSKSKV